MFRQSLATRVGFGRLDRGARAIYVIGPSGSGKSSLVQAGLLPVIAAGSSRLGRTFVARTMRPGERPAERLAHAIGGDLATPVAAIEAFVARHPPAERALVVIDQLEELFTLASADERQRFIAALEALRANTPCCFVLALRADFYREHIRSPLRVRADRRDRHRVRVDYALHDLLREREITSGPGTPPLPSTPHARRLRLDC